MTRADTSLARERIWRVYRRVLRKGRAIGADTPAAALHRLRIEAKKLRYLLEFFRSLFPEPEILPLIKALKQLQDNLGDFNDFEVQQTKLRAFAQQMHDDGRSRAATLMAMGRLVESLEAGQAEERQRFAGCFKQFRGKENRRSFRRLFAAAAGAG